MFLKRFGLASLVIGLGIGAAGCTDGYGYSGVNVGYASGYGNGYYDDGFGYYGAGYGGYGAGYGAGAFGWYGNYYYPGSGGYVYDRYRRPYRWNDGQRRYWEGRRGNYRGDRNWNGFDRGAANGIQGNRNFYRGDGVRGDGVRGNGVRGDGVRGDGVRGDRGSRGDRSVYRNRSNQSGVTAPNTTTQSFTPRGQGRNPGSTNGNGRGWRGSRERR